MNVLRNATSGTKTHKDAIDKINALCKEYNITLLDENATLDEQRLKYLEVKKAIQETTAEKIKAKYTEQALKDMTDAQTEAYNDLVEAAGRAKVATTTARGDLVYKENEAIQSGSKAMWEAVQVMALDAAEELKTLTGEAYDEAYKQSLARIVEFVKQSTDANDTQIFNFKDHIEGYFNDVVSETQKAQDEISKIDKQLAAFYGNKPDPTPVVESVEFVEMSFEDLDKKVKENQDEIDKLNAKIINPQTDTSQIEDLKKKLQECLGLQAQLNGALTTKTNDLNTDSGINERIKQLREMISTEQYGSEQRKKHIKELQQLQSKLQQNSPTQPKGKGGAGNSQESNNNNLEEKQLEAQRKLEEARIEVMEEGYAKRKATLDLQHKRELDRIAKEEKELEKARKKANPKSGGLTDEEKRNFEERRKLANQAYDAESIKLFDGEIEYKKRQYEAYFSWVRNVGQDVADAHFKNLLADGSSFITWVNSQIAQLEAKRQAQPQNFTAGDANALNSLKSQLNELTGQKSNMDLFK